MIKTKLEYNEIIQWKNNNENNNNDIRTCNTINIDYIKILNSFSNACIIEFITNTFFFQQKKFFKTKIEKIVLSVNL